MKANLKKLKYIGLSRVCVNVESWCHMLMSENDGEILYEWPMERVN